MTQLYLIDSNTFIDSYNDRLKTFDLDVFIDDYDCAISSITRMEVLGYAEISSEERENHLALFRKVLVIPVSRAIEDETISIRCKTSLKLPNAIIAATAVRLSAEVITHDDAIIKCKYRGLRVMAIQ